MTLSISISDYSGWRASSDGEFREVGNGVTESEMPEVKIIPPMLRRRLNLLGRACASEALKHLPDGQDMPIVYCSQHGDIQRTLKVLEELVDGEPVSPMQFSLAVHNAICGVLSIQTGNRGNITAIAAGQQGLVPVILEAAGILQQGAEQVLCLVCDVVLPEVYLDEDSLPETAYAMAFVVRGDDQGHRLELQCVGDALDENGIDGSSPMSLLDFISSGSSQSLVVPHNGSNWTLSRRI